MFWMIHQHSPTPDNNFCLAELPKKLNKQKYVTLHHPELKLDSYHLYQPSVIFRIVIGGNMKEQFAKCNRNMACLPTTARGGCLHSEAHFQGASSFQNEGTINIVSFCVHVNKKCVEAEQLHHKECQ